ncbi:MAG: hypothetical protein ACTSV6_08545 [Candidatus Heimdallarchaeota archaeon]
MRECYICGRESHAYCSECHRPICKVHLEEELKGTRVSSLCSSCLHKRKLKRLRIAILLSGIVLIVLIIGAVVFTALNLFG